MVAQQIDGAGAVGGLGHHLDARLPFEDAADAAAHQRVIVGEQHAHGAARSRRRPDRDVGVDPDAAVAARADGQPAAQRGDALAHAEPSHVRLGVVGGATPVVLDRQLHRALVAGHAHPRLRPRRRAWRRW